MLARFCHPLARGASARRHRGRGFTLVELLVVIGIIAILISVLMPALSRARSQANQVKCAANLRQMGQAMTMYLTQWKAYPGCSGYNGSVYYAVWPTRLRAFLNNNQGVFLCPSQEAGFEWPVQSSGGNASAADAPYGYNAGEALLNVFTVAFSYGYNDWGSYNVSGNHGLGADVGFPNGTPYVKVGRVKKAAEMIAIADNTCDGQWDFNVDPWDLREAVGKIHNKGCNVLFCDGHVSWYAQQELMLVGPGAPSSGTPRFTNTARMWNNDNEP